jgi:hypothetical protein
MELAALMLPGEEEGDEERKDCVLYCTVHLQKQQLLCYLHE